MIPSRPSETLKLCKIAREFRYSAEDPCSKDSDCMWDRTKKTCKMSCNLRSNDTCAAESICEIDVTTQKCAMTCVFA